MATSIDISGTATVGGISNFEHDRTSLRFVANVSAPLMQRPAAVAVVQSVHVA